MEAISGDRWRRQLGRSSSRLRGDDLDRRIVNLDPERLLRQHRAQRRLESQAQVRGSPYHLILLTLPTHGGNDAIPNVGRPFSTHCGVDAIVMFGCSLSPPTSTSLHALMLALASHIIGRLKPAQARAVLVGYAGQAGAGACGAAAGRSRV